MPPAVRIEAKAWDDPRFDILGDALGIHRDLALITMARVWAHQTEECSPTLPAVIMDAVARMKGFADAVVEAGLAERQADGLVRPRGTEGRIEWLVERRERAAGGRAVGGRARAAAARRGERGEFLPAGNQHPPSNGAAEPSNSQHSDQPHQLDEVAPAPAPAPVPAQQQHAADKPPPSLSEKSRELDPDLRRFIDLFTELYRQRNRGEKPTWEAKQVAIARRLVAAHGFDVCATRARRLLTSPPSWLRGGVDIGTLSAHFDKLTAPNAGQSEERDLVPLRRRAIDDA